jgi:acyl-CoA synthetase (AMP-forming)/AMP-acid ligase II
VPHDVLGELVACAVTLVGGAKATTEELIEGSISRLRRDARPVFIWVSDTPLARNINGKLIKTDIKKTVQEKYKLHLARQSKL